VSWCDLFCDFEENKIPRKYLKMMSEDMYVGTCLRLEEVSRVLLDFLPLKLILGGRAHSTLTMSLTPNNRPRVRVPPRVQQQQKLVQTQLFFSGKRFFGSRASKNQ
jgi:hypothetical protein